MILVAFLKKSIQFKKNVIGSFPDSLGIFYSAITAFLGFEVNDAEYKVMGLAAYGENTFEKEFKELIYFQSDQEIKINPKYFDLSHKALFPYKPEMINLLGLPAPNSKVYAEKFTSIEAVSQNSELKRFADIAHSAQARITTLVCTLYKQFIRPGELIGYAGVALNTKTNSELLN